MKLVDRSVGEAKVRQVGISAQQIFAMCVEAGMALQGNHMDDAMAGIGHIVEEAKRLTESIKALEEWARGYDE